MERILIFLIKLLKINPEKHHRNFYGIDELKLDSDFKNLDCEKLFTKLSKNQFKCDHFEFSSNIGSVKNLVVKISYGKIYYVRFDCIETTNISAIDSIMNDFEKYNILNSFENDSLPIKMILLNDGNVMFSKTLVKKENQLSYQYCDIKKYLRNSN